MKWYYVDNGQQAGPVEESEFPNLISAGKLRAETLVWREGMTNWEPFSTACTEAFKAATGFNPTANDAVCAECGGIFDKNEMIPHGSMHICAKCKPVFMQKLAEGVSLKTGTLDYASVGTRFGAILLDGILLWIVNFGIQMAILFGVKAVASSDPTTAVAMQAILFLLSISVGVFYETVMIGKFGATLGKMACKIKVVTGEGEPVTYLRAFSRYFAKLLSGLMCLIGYLMAFFDAEQRRTLHDRICNTRVVMK